MKVRITESKLRNLVSEVVKEELAGTYGVSDHMDTGEQKLEEVDGYGVSNELEEPGEMREDLNLSRGTNTIFKMQELVDEANRAYEEAKRATEDDFCLIGRMGGYLFGREKYGLCKPIVLSRGNVIISLCNPYEKTPDILNIKCFKTIGGKTVKFTDDMAYPDGGYQWAIKCLKGVIRDAKTGLDFYGATSNAVDDEEMEKVEKRFGF